MKTYFMLDCTNVLIFLVSHSVNINEKRTPIFSCIQVFLVLKSCEFLFRIKVAHADFFLFFCWAMRRVIGCAASRLI